MADGFGNKDVGSGVESCPLKKAASTEPTHCIEIELVGDDGTPIPWEEYLITLPNQEKVKGFLNQQGYSRVDGIKPGGNCQVTFPRLDTEAWDFVDSQPAKP